MNEIGRKNKALQQIIEQNESHYVLDVYLYVKDRLTGDNMCQPGNIEAKDGRLGIVPVVLHPSTIHSISTIQMTLPHNHKQAEKSIELMYFELMKRFKGDFPLLHPKTDMEIHDKLLDKLLEAQSVIKTSLSDPEISKLSAASQSLYDRKTELKSEIKELEDSIRRASNMIMSNELVNMKRVMRRLELCDRNDVTTLKGKVACSISASDEIRLTEMLFSGQLHDLKPDIIAALLSCLVFTDGGKGNGEGAN